MASQPWIRKDDRNTANAKFAPIINNPQGPVIIGDNSVVNMKGPAFVQPPAAETLSSEKPLAKNLPAEKPSAENPPTEKPSTEKLPIERSPPTEKQPSEQPRTEKPSAEKSPIEKPPSEQPPTEKPPTEKVLTPQPPTKQPPAENPPTEKPTAEKQPAEQPPTEKPPSDKSRAEQTLTEKPLAEKVSTEMPPTAMPPPEKPSAEKSPDENPLDEKPSTKKPPELMLPPEKPPTKKLHPEKSSTKMPSDRKLPPEKPPTENFQTKMSPNVSCSKEHEPEWQKNEFIKKSRTSDDNKNSFCSPRPFGVKDFSYRAGLVFKTEENREVEYKALTGESRGKLPWKIMEKARIFICGVLNNGGKGTIYFGIGDSYDKSQGFKRGEVIGLAVDKLRDEIIKAFQKTLNDHIESDDGKMNNGDMECVNIHFVPVHESKEHGGRYIVEVEVKRLWQYCKEKIYYIREWKPKRSPQKANLENLYNVNKDKWEDPYIRTCGESKKVGNKDVEKQIRGPLSIKYKEWLEKKKRQIESSSANVKYASIVNNPQGPVIIGDNSVVNMKSTLDERDDHKDDNDDGQVA